MNYNFFTLLLLFFIASAINSSAQCETEQLVVDDWIWTSGQMESQVWTAECDGELQEVEFWPDDGWESAPTATFYLRAYNGCANLWTVTGVSTIAGVVSTVNLLDGSGTSREVVNGTKYMLCLIADDDSEPSKLKLSVNNPYSGGSYAITTENANPWCDDFFPNYDLWFRASVDGALPVKLSYFNAALDESERQVELNWQTDSEQNNSGFEIQKSIDAQNWETIGFVPGKGTTSYSTEYQYIDHIPFPGDNYYQLKQIDFDGQFDFSSIEQIHFAADPSQLMSIYPNPSRGYFTVNIHNPDQQTAIVKLFDSTGRLIWGKRFNGGEMEVAWRKEFDLPQREVYFLSTQIGDQIKAQKVVVIDER